MTNKNSHLTLGDREIIETGIEKGAKKSVIAQMLGKDKSTIGKEIKLHRTIYSKCCFSRECIGYKHCKYGRICSANCPGYVSFSCYRRDVSPGACNGCTKICSCRFTKYKYIARTADKEYKETLVDSRQGVNLTTSEAKTMGNIIKPLLEQGQSPYQIIHNHPELGICEKTFYNYVNDGVFRISGIINADLRQKTSRKLPKDRQNLYKKREDYSYINGRKFEDYKSYMDLNPEASVVQMDTVYNDTSNGPFIQTFKLIRFGLLLGVLHQDRTSISMAGGLQYLTDSLGYEITQKYFNVILTDRGSEFSNPVAMELYPDQSIRTRIFYCDPMSAGQKGSLENKHKELRYICPHKVNLSNLGLTSQDKLNLALSHINSAPQEALLGKTPLQVVRFYAPDLFEAINNFGIHEIEKDMVILKPYLLR